MHDGAIVNQVKSAMRAPVDVNTAMVAMSCLDLTSLNDADTDADIVSLCAKATSLTDHHTAAICVYPQFIQTAKQSLIDSNVQIATVINFPHGHQTNDGDVATTENTAQAVKQAILDAATEIDIVVDYQSWKMNMDDTNARSLLRACRDACGPTAKMKVILETAAIEFENEIYDLSCLAIDEGADMIKTSTGKHTDGGATLTAVAAMAMAIRDTKKPCGIKISGGLKTIKQCAEYFAMTNGILGHDFIHPDRFRFGASGIYDDLKLMIENDGQPTDIHYDRTISPTAY